MLKCKTLTAAACSLGVMTLVVTLILNRFMNATAGDAYRIGNARLDQLHWQRPPDHAGRAHQHLFRPAADGKGRAFRHAARVAQALFTRASVGVAGADDDAADLGAGQSFTAHSHRRGADAVLREGSRRHRGPLADDQGEVEPVRIGPNAAMNARVTIAAG